MTTAYEELNSLEDLNMIAGSTWTLNFTIYEQDGTTLLDLTGGSTAYRLSPLGDSENTVLDKAGTVTGVGLWNVVLETDDTVDLSGVFVAQPRAVDFGGDIFIPAQGRVVILPNNPAI